jgi:hypothetical protein
VCGAPAECALVDLDTGATLTCDECGGKTVVSLQSVEAYTGASFYGDKHFGDYLDNANKLANGFLLHLHGGGPYVEYTFPITEPSVIFVDRHRVEMQWVWYVDDRGDRWQFFLGFHKDIGWVASPEKPMPAEKERSGVAPWQ